MGEQARHVAGGEKSAPGRGQREWKRLESGPRHMWDTPGRPTGVGGYRGRVEPGEDGQLGSGSQRGTQVMF